MNDEVKSNILACAQNLLNCWEKSIKEEINYTGMWRNYTVYTGISGYAVRKIINISTNKSNK